MNALALAPTGPLVPVLGLPSLDVGLGRRELMVEEGTSLAAMVEMALPGLNPARRALVRVMVGEWRVEPALWHRTRPYAGVPVVIRVIPAAGSLRSVLSVVVTIAAIAAGQFYAPAFLVGAVGQSAASAATTAAVAFAGNLLVNALVPVRPADSGRDPSYFISGWKNRLDPGAPIPSLLGQLRIAPPFGASPFTTTIGDDRFITAAFVLAGRYQLTDFKLGDTAAAEFGSDVEIEVKTGTSAEAPLDLYPTQVVEDQVSQELAHDVGEAATVIKRTAPADAAELSIDLHFPGGLFWVDKDGNEKSTDADVRLEQRLAGTDPWVPVAELNIAANTTRAFSRSHRWRPDTRGRYEIQETRLDERNEKGSDRVDWLAVRAHRPEPPFNIDQEMTFIAVRVKAGKMTNGVLDSFNFVATRILPDWDAATGTWIERPTRSPASAYRHAHQGPEAYLPKPDRVMNLAEIADWHDWCVLKNLHYDRMHDFVATQEEVLFDICQAGRARPHNPGTKWGVIIDRPQDRISAHISPRNSKNFAGEAKHGLIPDQFRIPFADATGGYEMRERLVRRPGLVGEPQRTERLNIVGKTDPDEVWREGIRRFYELEERQESWTCEQDIENLLVVRGKRVALSHDLIADTQISGRVVAVEDRRVVLDETVEMLAGQRYACRFRLADGETLLRDVHTVPGRTAALLLAGGGGLPAPGDLALFGLLGSETLDALVKDIEMTRELGARLILIPHAPEIDQKTAEAIPPAWDGRIGAEVVLITAAPLPPEITRIDTGVTALVPSDPDYPPVRVYLQPAQGSSLIASYEVRHRLAGAPAWEASIAALAASAVVAISGYVRDDIIEIEALAIGRTGLVGAWTATRTVTVGVDDPDALPPPEALQFPVTGSDVNGSWRNANDPRVAAARVWRAVAAAGFGTAIDVSGPIYSRATDTRSIVDAPGPGDWDYFVTNEDADGGRSAPAGPVAATVV